MNEPKLKQSGVTLLEVMLVLVIAAAILFFSIRQYEMWKADATLQEVKQNVDTVFQALSFFYRINCNGSYDETGKLIPGKLNPVANPPPKTNYPVNIEQDLVKAGLLQTKLKTIFPTNMIVDDTDVKTYGYIAQFNEQPPVPRIVCTEGTNSFNPTSPSCKSSTQIGTIIIWKAQVAILLRNKNDAQFYLSALGGDCLSNLSADGIVEPCDKSNGVGPYVVWERLPSLASPYTQSIYWQSNFPVKQFNQMYTTYPVTYLTASGGTTPGQPPPQPQQTQPQYFLCGG